jgi:hypothetical protein
MKKVRFLDEFNFNPDPGIARTDRIRRMTGYGTEGGNQLNAQLPYLVTICVMSPRLLRFLRRIRPSHDRHFRDAARRRFRRFGVRR